MLVFNQISHRVGLVRIDFYAFEIRIDIRRIKRVVQVMGCLGHSQDASECLDFERVGFYITEHQQNLRTRTVPAESDCLLEQ